MTHLTRLFAKANVIMSKVRAAALIATAVVAALMQSPLISTNTTVLQILLYVQGVVMFVTKFTPIGDQKPPQRPE